MNTTRLTTAASKTLADRLLLESDRSGFAERIILVTSGDAIGDEPHRMRLTLTAPGLRGLDEIRMNLRDWLAKSLPPISDDWIFEVGMQSHFDTGELEIVITMNDPEFLGHDHIMAAVRMFLAPVARENGRQVFTLRGGQRLVPLMFELDKWQSSWMDVTIPAQLKFVRARLVQVDYSEDTTIEARDFLRMALEMALDQFEWIGGVSVRRSAEGGCTVYLSFDGRTRPRVGGLNAAAAIIAQVVSRHARLEGGFFTNLVFVPAEPFCEQDDGDYNEDAGFLGEYREY